MANYENENRYTTKRRARRRHQKSRTGCKECKRRRIKCDEEKPSCTRCILSLKSCIYVHAAPSVVESRGRDELPLPNSSRRALALSPVAPAFSDEPLLSETSVYSAPTCITAGCRISSEEDSLPPSDVALYHHYLQHTSHISTPYHSDQVVFEIHIPTIALQSKAVFHSILALAAACLCRDMIADRFTPDAAAVDRVLMAGYRHYNRASEQMRELISQSDTLKPEDLLACAPFLIGFATASQHINYWVKSKKLTRDASTLLPASLRDTVVLIKGLRTTLHVLRRDDVGSSREGTDGPKFSHDIMSTLLGSDSCTRPTTLPPSRTHVMYQVFATTSQGAFSRLQERLDAAALHQDDNASLTNCAEAFKRLCTIRSLTFSSPALSTPSTPLSIDNASRLPHLPPWLRRYLGRPVVLLKDEPLTRPFLTFLIASSQDYLDLLLPLLDESLKDPMVSMSDAFPNLSQVQALALDIWAHWCVLMFLVEEEAWWIGNLPFILLTGMLNRYGDDFVTRLWPGSYQEKDRWWPMSMLACLREIKCCQ